MLILRKIASKIYWYLREQGHLNRYNTYRKTYRIAKSFRFNGFDISFYGDGQIICGEGSYVGSHSTLQSTKGEEIVIGKKCMVSHNVRIYTSTNNANTDWGKYDYEKKTGSVILEDYVWVGANVFISPGVRVGKCSVVGANSVVTKDVQPYTIVGGVPAKLIREKK